MDDLPSLISESQIILEETNQRAAKTATPAPKPSHPPRKEKQTPLKKIKSEPRLFESVLSHI